MSLAAAARRASNSVVAKGAITQPQKCAAQILPRVLWDIIARMVVAVLVRARFVAEPQQNAIIQTRPSAAKGMGLRGAAQRVPLAAVLGAALIRTQKSAAEIPPPAPRVMTASLAAAVVPAARFVAEATNAMIQKQPSAVKGTGLCGLAHRLRLVAALAFVMKRTLNSAVLEVPAPRRIVVASMSVAVQLQNAGQMDTAQQHLHHNLHLPRQAEHRHPPGLALAHQSSLRRQVRQQVRKHRACLRLCPRLLQLTIQVITYWLMANAYLSWTLSTLMASQKN